MIPPTDLIECLEGASVGSKALNMDVVEALGECAHRETEYYNIQGDSGFDCTACGKDPHRPGVPPVTTSLDDALALAERVLPGRAVGVSQQIHHGHWYAWLTNIGADGDPWNEAGASAAAPALALVAAILRASEQSK